MKRLVGVMGLIVFLTVVLTAGVLFAQQPAGKLPDFTIEKIYLTKDCMVAVVVKNLGPGPVPDEVWTVHKPKSAGVYLYKNGTGWGGASIWKFDPTKNLKNPGGTATYTSTLKVTGAAGIKAVVDLWNVVPEAKEGNNSLETKLTCEAQTGPCCIGGAYDGTYSDKPSATCKKPGTGTFTLDIKQQANCGSTIEGKVVNTANNNTHYLTGTVAPSGKCCKLVGELKGVHGTPTAGEVIQIKATLCKKGGKWFSTDGTYTNATGCSGTFTLKQK
ncbi:MAG: hypothetical protein A2Y65_07510 [Deltaproteobacteria bacterium RBG_13_52_11]|nr:MAG: hypothetical protein A2Y65_07510 [Deltaproteobacteria bacterium RBG_13_52_11]